MPMQKKKKIEQKQWKTSLPKTFNKLNSIIVVLI
jgi:hypothetical protein